MKETKNAPHQNAYELKHVNFNYNFIFLVYGFFVFLFFSFFMHFKFNEDDKKKQTKAKITIWIQKNGMMIFFIYFEINIVKRKTSLSVK